MCVRVLHVHATLPNIEREKEGVSDRTGRSGIGAGYRILMHAIGCSECSQSSAVPQRDCLSNSADFPSLRLFFTHNSLTQDLAATTTTTTTTRTKETQQKNCLITDSEEGEKNFHFICRRISAVSHPSWRTSPPSLVTSPRTPSLIRHNMPRPSVSCHHMDTRSILTKPHIKRTISSPFKIITIIISIT
jgi:hypothetical protein